MKFQQVEIPLLNENYEILDQETIDLRKKTIKIDLTRRLKGKSIEVLFKININEAEKKAVAEPKKLELMKFFIRRVIRKGTCYIEDSFLVKCKNAEVRIKPFLIARKKISRAVKKTLRNKAKELLIEYAKNKKSDELFSEIISNKLQKEISLKLKKIYPLSLCEIRILKVEKPLREKKEIGKIEVEKIK